MSEKKNYHTIRYGTAEGEIKFGHIHMDNVRSAVMLRSGHTHKHYITLDADGKDHRKYGTICRSPGSFQVKAGDGVPDEQKAIYLEARNGDIHIAAPKGTIFLEAIDVKVRATGEKGDRGNIVLDANDKVVGNGQVIDMKAKVAAKFFSEKAVEVTATNVLNMYGGFIDMADGATSVKGSKPGLATEHELRHMAGAFIA